MNFERAPMLRELEDPLESVESNRPHLVLGVQCRPSSTMSCELEKLEKSLNPCDLCRTAGYAASDSSTAPPLDDDPIEAVFSTTGPEE